MPLLGNLRNRLERLRTHWRSCLNCVLSHNRIAAVTWIDGVLIDQNTEL
jgi:hypothetical protein